jgi:Protein of unknown function (DUF4031)
VTIWIDRPAWPAHGTLWSHLISDTSFDELHAFAAANGIPRRACEGDHYDVPEERYAGLLAAGARPADGRDIVRKLQAGGLRIPKRKHERVLDSRLDPPWLPAGSRADVIASRQDDPPANTAVVRLLAFTADALLVVTRDDGSLDLPSRVVEAGRAEDSLRDVQVETLGAAHPAHLVGYVRNTVSVPGPAYRWPTPLACFAVFARAVDGAARFSGGHWLGIDESADRLGERHWWPLLPEFFSHPDGPARARG